LKRTGYWLGLFALDGERFMLRVYRSPESRRLWAKDDAFDKTTTLSQVAHLYADRAGLRWVASVDLRMNNHHVSAGNAVHFCIPEHVLPNGNAAP
jgi:hypothetical protein